MTINTRFGLHRIKSAVALLAVVALVSPWFFPSTAHAVSSWSPALLVNTESFQEIDAGDGSTNVELRFGASTKTLKFLTTNKFQFSHSLSVLGNLSGSTLNVDGYAGIYGALTVSGATTLRSATTINGATTINAATKVRGNLSGTTLNVDGFTGLYGGLSVSGTTVMRSTLNIRNSAGVNASGSVITNGNLTINSDTDTNDAVLTFGNQTASKALTYSNANQRFEFNNSVKVTGGVRASGNLSGSTLNVDGDTILRGTTYQWPTSQGASNTFLRNDGAGGLSWTTTSVGSSSGLVLSLAPQYRNAIYTASGTTSVGQLTQSGAFGTDNLYRWSTSRGTLQDYWISVKVQVPKNFTHFTGTGGIQLRLRTATNNPADNYVTFRMLDTNNAPVAVTNNAQLVNSTANIWRTVNIGNVTSGTYAAGGYITLLIKLAATSSGYADLGYINFNWSSTTP